MIDVTSPSLVQRPLFDVHSHVLPADLPRPVVGSDWSRWPSVQRDGDTAQVYVGDRWFRTVDHRCWSVEARLADLDAAGIGVQVVSPTPVTLCHDAPGSGATELARFQNDWLAQFQAAAPDRLLALGAVPLQDVDAACTELERCVTSLGLAGVEVGTVAGPPEARVELADARLRPLFATAERLGAVVFIHPANLPCGPRLAPYDLGFGVGMPCETATAAAQLITAGLLVDHPRLKLLLAHGGGALAWVLPRMDRGWQIMPSYRDRLPQPPSRYARRLWVDSLTYDAANLALAVERFGGDHVMIGTDAPFAARPDRTDDVLRDSVDLGLLDEPAGAAIAHGNACSLFAVHAAGSTDPTASIGSTDTTDSTDSTDPRRNHG